MLILAAMLMPVMLFGQEELIKSALSEKTRVKGQFCGVHNTSAILQHEELQSYCKQNGYYLRGEIISKVRRFNTVTYFEVLPEDEADNYIYDCKCDFKDKPSFDALSTIGKGCFFTYSTGELFDNIKWSGTVQNGLINGKGIGCLRVGKICYFISGEFVNGFPKGEVIFSKYDYFNSNNDIDDGIILPIKPTFGEFSDGMAWVKRDYDTKYGFVNSNGKYVVTNKYEKIIQPFRNGHAEVVLDNREIIIDKNCNFIDNTERQKKMDEEVERERQRIQDSLDRIRQRTQDSLVRVKQRIQDSLDRVKQRIQDSLDRIRQRIQDSLDRVKQRIQDSLDRIKQDSLDRIERARVEEERRRAAHERKITVNCNYKLWTKGDHICYVFPNGSYKDKITCGTLEEWNENRTKAHIKIVTSPSNSLTYDGELLEKNNTFWISTQGTKWHLAIQGEFEKSLEYDNSKKSPDVIYVNNQSSSDVRRYNDCSYCHGSGRLKCLSCHGSGWDSWDDKTCTSCRGQGTEQCYHCGGTGKE